MSFEQFKESLKSEEEPTHLGPALTALWWDAKGDWDAAHRLAQDAGNSDGDWIHAYLHRKEGDDGNARYWYSRAGKPFCESSLEEEWVDLCETLLGRTD